MSTLSKRPSVQTLKGLFSSPRKIQGRNFLLENKRSIREMARMVDKKNASKTELSRLKKRDTQQQIPTSPHHRIPIKNSQTRPRSSSQQRNHIPHLQEDLREAHTQFSEVRQPQVHQQTSRHHQHHHNPQQQHKIPQKDYGTRKLNEYKQKQLDYDLEVQEFKLQRQKANNINHEYLNCSGDNIYVGASNKNSETFARNQNKVCDREIQTDDISDEKFLHEALNRCSSNKIRSRNCDINSNIQHHKDVEIREEPLQNGSANYNNEQADDYVRGREEREELDYPELPLQTGESDDEKCSLRTIYDNRQAQLSSARTLQSHKSNLCEPEININHENISSVRTHAKQNGPTFNEKELNHNMESMSLAGAYNSASCHNYAQQLQHQPTDTQSIYSRQSMHSIHTQGSSLSQKKSPGYLHKLGSREDIKLPRYLEREKRVKEEQRLRELERDPNCPPGHVGLSENERLVALSAAKQKFQGLVNELNRMPMTNQTLRVRRRKDEIEKELSVIETDIRTLSKPKVYVKIADDSKDTLLL